MNGQFGPQILDHGCKWKVSYMDHEVHDQFTQFVFPKLYKFKDQKEQAGEDLEDIEAGNAEVAQKIRSDVKANLDTKDIARCRCT